MSISPFLKALIISTFLHAQLTPATAEVTRPGQPASNATSNVNSSSMQSPPQNQGLSSDALEYLNSHNKFRRKKGVPPLQWDAKLAKYAQDWARNCINECDPHHHSGGPYGENTLWEQYDEKTPSQVTKVWKKEAANYDHVKMACKCEPNNTKCMCGHYTQLVWSTTKAVGCANVTCNNELGVLIVCSYYPPGNYHNQNPFGNAHYSPPPPSTGGVPKPPPPPSMGGAPKPPPPPSTGGAPKPPPPSTGGAPVAQRKLYHKPRV